MSAQAAFGPWMGCDDDADREPVTADELEGEGDPDQCPFCATGELEDFGVLGFVRRCNVCGFVDAD